MKAVTFLAPRALACATVPEPRLERTSDVVLRVDLAAICGSDLHVYRGIERGLDQGTVLGHEFLGTVVEAGNAPRRAEFSALRFSGRFRVSVATPPSRSTRRTCSDMDSPSLGGPCYANRGVCRAW